MMQEEYGARPHCSGEHPPDALLTDTHRTGKSRSGRDPVPRLAREGDQLHEIRRDHAMACVAAFDVLTAPLGVAFARRLLHFWFVEDGKRRAAASDSDVDLAQTQEAMELPTSGDIITSPSGRRFQLLEVLAKHGPTMVYRAADEQGKYGSDRLFAVVLERDAAHPRINGATVRAALAEVPPAMLGSKRRVRLQPGDTVLVAFKFTPRMQCEVYYVDRADRFSRFRRRRKGGFGQPARRKLYDLAGGCCQRCGSVDDLRFDHILPRALGGTDDVDNGQVLCAVCHQLKTSAEPRINYSGPRRRMDGSLIDGAWYPRLVRSAIYLRKTGRFVNFSDMPLIRRLGPYPTQYAAERAARALAQKFVQHLRWPPTEPPHDAPRMALTGAEDRCKTARSIT